MSDWRLTPQNTALVVIDVQEKLMAAMPHRQQTIAGIQIVRENSPGGFSVRVTLYAKADQKIADRAMKFVQREKRRHFHLIG